MHLSLCQAPLLAKKVFHTRIELVTFRVLLDVLLSGRYNQLKPTEPLLILVVGFTKNNSYFVQKRNLGFVSLFCENVRFCGNEKKLLSSLLSPKGGAHTRASAHTHTHSFSLSLFVCSTTNYAMAATVLTPPFAPSNTNRKTSTHHRVIIDLLKRKRRKVKTHHPF